MRGQHGRLRQLGCWGIPILLLGLPITVFAAEPQIARATESPATSDVKPDSPHSPASAAPHGQEKESEKEAEKTEEEAKCIDQRLLLAVFHPLVERYPAEKEWHDLTFTDFCTEGWHVGWKEPEEGPDDSVRSRLLRIQPAFWERELRFLPVALEFDRLLPPGNLP